MRPSTGRGPNLTSSTVRCSPWWWTGSPDHAAVRIASVSSNIPARVRSSAVSPNAENSRPNRSLPSPAPSTSRPPLSRSSVTVSRASLPGRRRGSAVTIGPRWIDSVAAAMADSVSQASAISCWAKAMWSQTKNPSQPRSSASTARPTASIGSASSSNNGTQIAWRSPSLREPQSARTSARTDPSVQATGARPRVTVAEWSEPAASVQVTTTESPGSWAATARWSWSVRRHRGAADRGDGVAGAESRVLGGAAVEDSGQRGARTGERDAEERVVPERDRGRLLTGHHAGGDPQHPLDRDDVAGDVGRPARGGDVHPDHVARRSRAARRRSRPG